MALTIQLRRGTRSQLNSLNTGMAIGEPLYATDTHELYVATGTTTKKPAVVDVAALEAFTESGQIEKANDLIYMYDVNVAAPFSGQVKARKITFNQFKTALNIPDASTDELVAVNDDGTPGYLGNGTNGVIRMGSGLAAQVDGTNDFVTYSVRFDDEAHGDLLYRGASAWGRLAPGTGGNLLMTNGASAAPTWTNLIDGGTFS